MMDRNGWWRRCVMSGTGEIPSSGAGVEVLTPDQCWALLRSAEVGRLAVSIVNRPDIFPVNHIVDHGSVVFRTAEGTKLAAAVLGEAVAYEADGYDAGRGEAWSVVVKGRAVEIERIYELLDATDLPLFPWHAAPKNRFVRIEPESVTGRRFHVIEREVAEPTESGAMPG
jgi:nitroimidazol reductase NimA-like FMN-containing flavoprotein (pyridoxamine 5'-phosphate oxidase superfamily)